MPALMLTEKIKNGWSTIAVDERERGEGEASKYRFVIRHFENYAPGMPHLDCTCSGTCLVRTYHEQTTPEELMMLSFEG
jgi:hypothetical protein